MKKNRQRTIALEKNFKDSQRGNKTTTRGIWQTEFGCNRKPFERCHQLCKPPLKLSTKHLHRPTALFQSTARHPFQVSMCMIMSQRAKKEIVKLMYPCECNLLIRSIISTAFSVQQNDMLMFEINFSYIQRIIRSILCNTNNLFFVAFLF